MITDLCVNKWFYLLRPPEDQLSQSLCMNWLTFRSSWLWAEWNMKNCRNSYTWYVSQRRINVCGVWRPWFPSILKIGSIQYLKFVIVGEDVCIKEMLLTVKIPDKKTSNFHILRASKLPAHLPEIIKSKGWDINIEIIWFGGFLTLRWSTAGCNWKGWILQKCSGDMKIPHRILFKGDISISVLCFMKLPLKLSCNAVHGSYLSKKCKGNNDLKDLSF